jgi:hypothetical protein
MVKSTIGFGSDVLGYGGAQRRIELLSAVGLSARLVYRGISDAGCSSKMLQPGAMQSVS